MNLSLLYTRTLFFVLSVFFMTFYMVSGESGHHTLNLLWGVLLGSALGSALIGFDLLFKRFNLRSFNIAILGLFFGYLMGQALVLILEAVLQISTASIHLDPKSIEILKIALFLFGVYLGTLFTLRSSDELYVSIPFVKLTTAGEKKRDLLVDLSVLQDARIIDLAASGILDGHLIIPRFLLKDLYVQAESHDETSKNRAKRALEVVKKLEGMTELDLRFNDTDFAEIKEHSAKLIRLARLLDSNILSADLSRIQTPSIEGVRTINVHALSNALKPLMESGEHLQIKIQRYGKEPRQGVGYLEDGTMVVVNGGGDYIGEVIEAQVLSVKHTSSGRIIFCNAPEDDMGYPDEDDEDRP